LRIASEKGLKSIAFPAVGTGVARFPVEECARIMLGEVVQHLRGESVLETVYFVLFDAPTRATFEKTWERMKRELAAGAAGA
jgi:O-acetyl-ADP-ribose deacetylase (regulator of RNase III)